MLKSTVHSIAPVLTSIFNLSLQSRTFPSDSHIVPIPKTNFPSSPSDFRPISLLSIVSKYLNAIIIIICLISALTITSFLTVSLVFVPVSLLNLLFSLLLILGFLFLIPINLFVLSFSIYAKHLIPFPIVLSLTLFHLYIFLLFFFTGFMIITVIGLNLLL